ncbi:MAG TPA: alkaline phosphatase family protein [Syntrophales bacterium]|nr:alkaline phosphatase family protein [Syntrophales bacterium]
MPNIHSAMSTAIRGAYRNGKEDETFPPFVLVDRRGLPVGRLKNGDAVIYYNIRGEREIELTQSLTDTAFGKFPVESNLRLKLCTMIEYQKGLPVRVAFPPEETIPDTLSEIIARRNLKQAKVTESEKASHVGFFLNGKKADLLPGEERIIVPSRRDIILFDKAPEMSIHVVTEKAKEKICDPSCSFIFVNFPNVDVVGHIDNQAAILKAVEAVDICTGLIVDAAIREGVAVIVSSDHGTVERWLYPDGTIDTGHTDSPVPFILAGSDRKLTLREGGELADIAPTVLDLMGIPKSPFMTGRSLIDNGAGHRADAQGKTSKRVLLLILDGWGERDDGEGNLIAKAGTPSMDRLKKTHPHTQLTASGEAVGLSQGTVGNSEAGHLHIGAGRRILSDKVRIDQSIADGSFFRNEAFLDVMRTAKESGSALHLMGIVSFFSSHGSIEHLIALLDLAKQEGVKDVFIHAMLGRRGEMLESGAKYIAMVEEKCGKLGFGKVASVIGRYWSMDREENWSRIEKAYRMLVYGEGAPVTERS